MNLNQLKLSYRNVTRQSKRSLMLGLAMAFGVMISITINAFTAGMSNSAVENFSTMLGGHVYVTGAVVSESGRSQSMITDTQVLEDALGSVSGWVSKVNYRSSARANISFGSASLAGTVQGVDFSAESNATAAMNVVVGSVEEAIRDSSIIIPESAASELNVTIGDSVFVKANTVSGQQNLVEWLVGAIIEDSNSFEQLTVYAPLEQVNSLIAIDEGTYQQANIEITDLTQMDAIREQLKNYLETHASIKVVDEEENGMIAMRAAMMGGLTTVVDDPWDGTQFDVTNLNDTMSDIMSLVGVMQVASNGVFAVILIIIMVGITNSYRMVILERVQEIGTMRAMGAQRNWIFNLFVSESVMIAVLGSLAGILASLGVMTLLGNIDVGSNGGPMQMFSIANYLQFPVSASTFIGPSLITLIIAAMAVYMPARTAARMAPGDALRAAS
jgi:putative ABC transport system permease protein